MKKVIPLFFACLCATLQLHAQECEVIGNGQLDIMYPATQINLFDEHRLDMSKMPLLDPPVKNLSSVDSVYWAYISRSDSTIMVFVTEDVLTFFKFCSSKAECDSMGSPFLVEDVVIDEFLRLQNAGVFGGSASEADSLIRHIVAVMGKRRTSGLYSVMYGLPHNEDVADIYVPVAGFCFYQRSGHDVYFCGLIDSVRQCPELFEGEAPLGLKSPVPQVPIQGMQFRAFDLNGNLIRSGKWREEYADEFRTPTIVRFENGLAVPLSRKKVH
ncbi:MAG: hypothetical protein IKN70_07620 [Fibrobacter sp.]|nr:hypothetical protein [Fibrobacter sp.]